MWVLRMWVLTTKTDHKLVDQLISMNSDWIPIPSLKHSTSNDRSR